MPTVFRRLQTLLRLPALLLLMLVALANPAIAAIGDTHEASLGHAGHVEAAADVHEDEDGTSDLLHALSHGVHGCGHMTAMLPQACVWLSSAIAAARPAGVAGAPYAAPLAMMLRPPIAA